MKKRKILGIIATTACTMGILAGCGSTEDAAKVAAETQETTNESADTNETEKTEEVAETVEETSEEEAEEVTDLSGSLSLAGSTSMEKLCEAMSESFMEANPGVTVTVEYTGSSAGIESLTQGSVDIGNASRGLKD
nr:substrate-binding domain-containing protein [Butyrivibrio sp.]